MGSGGSTGLCGLGIKALGGGIGLGGLGSKFIVGGG